VYHGVDIETRHPYGWRVEAGVGRVGRYVAAHALTAGNARRVFPDQELLLRFVGLAEESEEGIVAFASAWGMLGLCHRGLAPGHDAWIPGGPLKMRQHTCSRRIRDGFVLESFEDWRLHARRAAAILSLGAVVHDPKARPTADWSSIGLRSWRTGSAAFNLARLLNEWLELGRVRPGITVVDPTTQTALTDARVEFIVDGLYGGIGLLLLMAVARSDEVIPCSERGCTGLARPGRRGTAPCCDRHLGPATRNRDRQRRYKLRHPGPGGEHA
jgi:hypothetical protein